MRRKIIEAQELVEERGEAGGQEPDASRRRHLATKRQPGGSQSAELKSEITDAAGQAFHSDEAAAQALANNWEGVFTRMLH